MTLILWQSWIYALTFNASLIRPNKSFYYLIESSCYLTNWALSRCEPDWKFYSDCASNAIACRQTKSELISWGLANSVTVERLNQWGYVSIVSIIGKGWSTWEDNFSEFLVTSCHCIIIHKTYWKIWTHCEDYRIHWLRHKNICCLIFDCSQCNYHWRALFK